MTTDTDKLVEMARATGAFHAIKGCDWLTFELPQLAAFRDRIIASLCGDVEPVAWLHKQGAHTEPSERELLEDEKERGWTQKPLYPASTVAALKARVAELEEAALQFISDFGQAQEQAEKAAAITKGQQ